MKYIYIINLIKIIKKIYKSFIFSLAYIVSIFISGNTSSNFVEISDKEVKRIPENNIYMAAAEKIELEGVTPKIFAPDEGDRVRFAFTNPNYDEITIRIFDITGSEVKKNLWRESENVMYWDGTDENDNIVRGGIYLYQLESAGDVINGSIIVVR